MDGDIFDRLRQFEVVCRVAIQLAGLGSQSHLHLKQTGGIAGIGKDEFGLTAQQVKYCLGRARNFLAEARELERARNATRLRQTPTEWSYL